MKSKLTLAALVSIFCFVTTNCAIAKDTEIHVQPAQTELEHVGKCLEHVLKVWPDFMGGGEQFAKQLALMAEMEGDHGTCENLSITNGVVRLSSGEIVEIKRMKFDIRCECISVWAPQFFVTAGKETIIVLHPENPKDCNELCPQKGTIDK